MNYRLHKPKKKKIDFVSIIIKNKQTKNLNLGKRFRENPKRRENPKLEPLIIFANREMLGIHIFLKIAIRRKGGAQFL